MPNDANYMKEGGSRMKLYTNSWALEKKVKQVSKVLTLENVTMMNIQLKKDEVIPEHDSTKEVIIVVRKGSVTFTVENKDIVVNSENVLHMAPNEKHSLLANEDSDIMVLQITP